MQNLLTPLWFLIITSLMIGCSSHRKADLAVGDDPVQAVSEVSRAMQEAQQDQIDVLADETYEDAVKYLKKAQKDLDAGEPAQDVLENAAIAKAFFEDARKIAKPRKDNATRILKARASALKANVRASNELIAILDDIDDELKSETKQFSRTLEPEDFSELQKAYLVLESRAVQFTELKDAKDAIDHALKNDADDLAPVSLRAATLDYEEAMNIIARSPRSPSIYKNSVNDVIASATQLYDVMNIILGAKGTPENIAVQMVKQKRALGELSTNIGNLKANLQTTKQSLQTTQLSLKKKETDLERTKGVLKTQEEQLERASKQVRFQQAMEEAQKELSQDDALVYQQGSNLVFRLKRVNFKTGTASIPEPSKQLIAKVNAIIKKLDAKKVIVQGHTDSIGPTTVNKRLSTERATGVATYLHSLRGGYKITYKGYGESKPIASNKTEDGRATNRRVDLVVSVKE
ncbi:MAG: OmpA family protein [Gammaproteobacteria bacterium]|nr:OmpA family protein [Gammaproteobacteria bacterium]MDH5776715.1 OmpA family protein [Gammaproteobacteria bacterium]